MTNNLPLHLREKMEASANKYATKQYGVPYTDAARELMAEEFISGYQQAYSDIMQELGPLVKAIESLKCHCHFNCNCGHDEVQKALKHLKERILTQERTGG